jgi:hypothetical protein
VSDTRRRPRSWLAFAGFAVVAAFFLVTEHRAHLYGILPLLFLILCPLLHLFGHGGGDHGRGDHGGHDAIARRDNPRDRP